MIRCPSGILETAPACRILTRVRAQTYRRAADPLRAPRARRGTGLAIDDHGTVHILALVTGTLIVASSLWDAFETLVLPRTPRRRLRFSRGFYRATWAAWTASARRIRSNERREQYLAVYGPLSVFVLLTMWAAALVVGFALLQWS